MSSKTKKSNMYNFINGTTISTQTARKAATHQWHAITKITHFWPLWELSCFQFFVSGYLGDTSHQPWNKACGELGAHTLLTPALRRQTENSFQLAKIRYLARSCPQKRPLPSFYFFYKVSYIQDPLAQLWMVLLVYVVIPSSGMLRHRITEFKAILVYTVSTWSAWAT